MRNELLLILSIAALYGTVLLWYRLFGAAGLFCYSAVATVAANIEVLILVEAFGVEMTLGNILFASTFLVTDLLSELEGKRAASRAVLLSVASSVLFLVLSQSWMLYRPAAGDFASASIRQVFSNTPRLMLASLAVYAAVQAFDVWAYHKWWAFTTKRFGDARRFLWLRNNGSTLLSQFLNTLLYTFAAFLGVYGWETLWAIIASSYLIFVITSLADTPVVYLARRLRERDDRRAEPAAPAA